MGIQSVARVGHGSWLDEKSRRYLASTWPNVRRFLTSKEAWGTDRWVQLGVRSQAGRHITDVVGLLICIIPGLRKYSDTTTSK